MSFGGSATSSDGRSATAAPMARSPLGDRWLRCCVCQQPLRDPIQLQCLDNCCSHCLERIRILSDDEAMAAPGVGSRPPGPVSARCPACNETCLATVGLGPTAELNENSFVASQLQSKLDAAKKRGATTCGVCERLPATQWCDQCVKHLCDDCLRWHGKFNKDHVVAPASTDSGGAVASSPAAAPAAVPDEAQPSCPLHRSPYEFSCRQCRSLKCAKCKRSCATAGHALDSVAAGELAERLRQVAAAVRESQKALTAAAAAAPVANYERLLDDLKAARERDGRRLEESRDRAAAELQRAYADAEQALDEAHEAMQIRARALLAVARAVGAGTELATAYGDALIASGDASGLAYQQGTLLSRANVLKKRAAVLQSSPLPAADACVRLEAEQDVDGLAATLRKWLGVPKSIPADGLFAEAANGHLGGIFDDASGGDDNGDGGDVVALLFESTKPSAAAAAAVSCDCADVALTSDGHLLLSLLGSSGERGLKEFDSDGHELRYWQPPRPGGTGQNDFVWAVDALDDGRVAAGLLHSQFVQLLRRGPAADSWVRDRKVALKLHPWRLAALGDALAVAGGRLQAGTGGAATLTPGPNLVVFAAALARDDGDKFELTLGYDVHGLAIVDSAVVVSSTARVPAAPGGGGGETASHVVEALSRRDGSLVWRYRSDEPVVDVCAHGAVLYLAAATSVDGGRLLAVGRRDGKKLPASGAGGDCRLAVDDGGGRAAPSSKAKPLCAAMRASAEKGVLLAVLFSDRRSVRTYSAAAAV